MSARRKQGEGYRLLTTSDPDVFMVQGNIEAFNEDQAAWKAYLDRMARDASAAIDRIHEGSSVQASEMVRQFHEVFGCAINERTEDVIRQRRRLIEEEFIEVYDELRFSGDRLALFGRVTNLPFVAKELADLVYVAYGAAIALGIDLDKAVALVHESNMSKLGPDGKPILREDGKVLKGPNYFEPDMAEAVR